MVRGPTLQRGLWAAPYGLTFPSSPTLTVEEECEKIKSEAERERGRERERETERQRDKWGWERKREDNKGRDNYINSTSGKESERDIKQ